MRKKEIIGQKQYLGDVKDFEKVKVKEMRGKLVKDNVLEGLPRWPEW